MPTVTLTQLCRGSDNLEEVWQVSVQDRDGHQLSTSHATFTGPRAELLAKEYADYMNGSRLVHQPAVPPLELRRQLDEYDNRIRRYANNNLTQICEELLNRVVRQDKKITEAQQEFESLKDPAMPKSLIGMVRYMIEHSNEGWERVAKLMSKPPSNPDNSDKPYNYDRVQWQTPDGAWHTGMIVRLPVCTDPKDIFAPKDGYGGVLVRHDHTNELQFVKQSVLQRRPMRDEFEPGEHPPPKPWKNSLPTTCPKCQGTGWVVRHLDEPSWMVGPGTILPCDLCKKTGVAPTIGPANEWNAGAVDCTAD